MTVLKTKRLTLRAARDEDIAPLFSIYSHPLAMKHWGSPAHSSPEDTGPLLKRLKAPGDRLYFVFDLDDLVIGTGGVHQDAELGFILHPDHWGKGFALEACTAIIKHVWGATSFSQITADADPRNLASVGLLTRLGFQVTGFAAKNFMASDTWQDSVYFRMLRP